MNKKAARNDAEKKTVTNGRKRRGDIAHRDRPQSVVRISLSEIDSSLHLSRIPQEYPVRAMSPLLFLDPM